MAVKLRADQLYHPSASSIHDHLLAVAAQPTDQVVRHLLIGHRADAQALELFGPVELAECHVLRHAANPELIRGDGR